MFSKKFWAAPLVGLALIGASSPVWAQGSTSPVAITQSPANWMLNLYVPNNVDVWYVSGVVTACQSQGDVTNGHLTFDRTGDSASATQDDMNRFWSMVLTAKSIGRNMTVWYDPVHCWITSFNLV